MPRSASVVGLAKRGVIPQKQFYIKMSVFNTVILARNTAAGANGTVVTQAYNADNAFDAWANEIMALEEDAGADAQN